MDDLSSLHADPLLAVLHRQESSRMRPRRLAPAALLLAATLAACVPPRESLDGQSVDGRTRVALDLQSAVGDSVKGTGTLRLAGHPVSVRLRGRWNDVGDGVRSLEGTLQADTKPGERWAIEWSASDLNGSLRPVDSTAAEDVVSLTMPAPR
jgi:hypothetical protein